MSRKRSIRDIIQSTLQTSPGRVKTTNDYTTMLEQQLAVLIEENQSLKAKIQTLEIQLAKQSITEKDRQGEKPIYTSTALRRAIDAQVELDTQAFLDVLEDQSQLTLALSQQTNHFYVLFERIKIVASGPAYREWGQNLLQGAPKHLFDFLYDFQTLTQKKLAPKTIESVKTIAQHVEYYLQTGDRIPLQDYLESNPNIAKSLKDEIGKAKAQAQISHRPIDQGKDYIGREANKARNQTGRAYQYIARDIKTELEKIPAQDRTPTERDALKILTFDEDDPERKLTDRERGNVAKERAKAWRQKQKKKTGGKKGVLPPPQND